MIKAENKILKYFTSFFSVEVILFVGSFITFPIFTRILTKDEYGLMSLITLTLFLIVTLMSGGLNHSVLRFYNHYEKNNLSSFVETLRLSSFIFGIIAILLFVFIVQILQSTNIIGVDTWLLLLLVSPLILIRIVSRLELTYLRIKQNIFALNLFNILIRYGGIGASITLVLIYKNLISLYAGLCLAELFILLVIIFSAKKNYFKISFNREILKESLHYGIPLGINALFIFIMTAADKYVIGYFEGAAKVAEYSVAFNFCNYAIELLRNVFLYTFIPLIMSDWNNKDEKTRHNLLTHYLSSYFWLIAPIAVGLSMTSHEGIRLLAGSQYGTTNKYLVPVLAVSLGINGLSFIYTSGLLYKKRTKLILNITILLTVFNLGANIVFVQMYGLIGAAVSSLLTQIAYLFIGGCYTFRIIKFRIPYREILLSLICGLFIWGLIRFMPTEIISINPLFMKISIGISGYLVFLAFVNPSKIKELIGNFGSA
ncbi:oligosaccharide flippase family protein [candidate division KSB1 bacterium]|nr:oligosaccharide flippase family protein [candidate division KSB1 bacterium]